MNRFADVEAEGIYLTASSERLPKGLVRRAYRAVHVLVDAHELQDVGVIGPIRQVPRCGNRLAVGVDGKWYFTFNWERAFGSVEIRLERLKIQETDS